MARRSFMGSYAWPGLAMALLFACSTKYEPHLALSPSPFPILIDAKVELHPFIAGEELRSGHVPYGVVAEDYVNHRPSKMSKIITAQILEEFEASGVFRKISTYEADPDFVLTGRVEKFVEHDRRKIWTYLPYFSDKLAGLFRLNTYVRSGEVQLTMFILSPAGELVHTYSGQAKFDEDFTPNDDMPPGERLNRAFSQVITQIRDEMLTDATLPKRRKSDPHEQDIKR
ncbi:MAG: hypothetical protein ABW047_12895 [Nitrospiraceae bacterium]